ncbi:MAG: acyltransferase family protein [Parvibaculaceae bacterium]
MFQNRTLAECLDERRNSFNLVRLVAALSVIVSHGYLLMGQGDAQPLKSFTPYTIGQHAVNVFFVLSGLMLTRSLYRDPSLANFALSRALRIFPALFAFGIAFAFLAGPFLSTLSVGHYLSDTHTLLYPIAILVQFNMAPAPHGIFTGVPMASAINDSLWTIRYEITAYVCLAILFGLGLLRTATGAAAFLGLMLLAMIAYALGWLGPEHSPVEQLSRYGFCFLVGVNLYHWRARISNAWAWLIPTALAAVFLHGTLLAAPAFILLAGHAAILFGTRDFGALTSWTRETDISYGTYIYGWPVQQTLLTMASGITPAMLAFCSLLVVPVCGLLSWRYVEEPALRLKRSLRLGRQALAKSPSA